MANTLYDYCRQRFLEAERAAEVMQQVGVRAADAAGHRLERDRLRPRLDQQIARRVQRHLARRGLAEAFAYYY